MHKNYLRDKAELTECRLCPRNCGVNRQTGSKGYCGCEAGFLVSSIGLHFGEEPVLSGTNGICNVFFSKCNLSCIYCQNYQISNRNALSSQRWNNLENIVKTIELELDQSPDLLGFVSPSHQIPQMLKIISTLNVRGRTPAIVYNTNAYDTLQSLRDIEEYVDVFLPDFKYMDRQLAKAYSGAKDYPGVAGAAIKEMYRQKGSRLCLNDQGKAGSGLIIRHLVLPGHVDNSLRVLDWIAENLSVNVHVSLMSQYNPTPKVFHHPTLRRKLQMDEYMEVVEHFHTLGFSRGWVQELSSSDNYNPDFDKDKPFDED